MAKVEVEIRKLLNKGKGKGYLTYDEVNDILPEDTYLWRWMRKA